MNNQLQRLREEIVAWYRKNGRDFPWRHTKDPYRIMMAEFMLHRTKAEQIVPVYEKFLKAYPDVASLSKASIEDIVDNFTIYLGLHWRAAHFVNAAKHILEACGGKFPREYSELRKIPGVGEYIAGAISNLCFDKPTPAIDSNIARLINRYCGLKFRGELRRKKDIMELAKILFETDNPRELLFGIIDFTSSLCKPGKPSCHICPVKENCFSSGDRKNRKAHP